MNQSVLYSPRLSMRIIRCFSCILQCERIAIRFQSTSPKSRKRVSIRERPVQVSSPEINRSARDNLKGRTDFNGILSQEEFAAQNKSFWLSHPKRNKELCDYLKHKYLLLRTSKPRRNDDIQVTIDRVQAKLKESYRTDTPIVHAFGSAVTSVGLPSGDLDLSIELPSKRQSDHPLRKIWNLAKLLRKLALQNDFLVIPKARVPIIKYVDAKTKIKVDINVGHTLGLHNSELIRSYMNLDPRLRPLVMLIKDFAAQNNMNDSANGTFSSYTLTLMAIAFLQEFTMLPSLQLAHSNSNQAPILVKVPVIARRKDRAKPKEIQLQKVDVSFIGETSFLYTPLRIKPDSIWEGTEGIISLFASFLRYYGSIYPYTAQYVVSVKHGKTLHRPPSKANNIQSDTLSLIVLDPFQIGRNVAASAEYNLNSIRAIFRSASIALDSGASLEHLRTVLFPRDV